MAATAMCWSGEEKSYTRCRANNASRIGFLLASHAPSNRFVEMTAFYYYSSFFMLTYVNRFIVFELCVIH